MRETENIRAVEENVRPNMMGFIFWEGSKRCVTSVPTYLPQCTRVGVFVNPTEELVLQKITDFGLNAIQLHGEESPDFCRRIKEITNLTIIKAISIDQTNSSLFTLRSSLYEGISDYFIFDTKCKNIGGSGEQFKWDILQFYKGNIPFLLAGGIGPGDEEKIRQWHHPKWAGIDLNSKFELAPAYKDTNALADFIKKIKSQPQE
ncbi:MAG: phosphoribosylanthranilate isomerase [Bacteroidaceae bacterium]|nr:phosphoribosylanthranilate isomerase [Bacteroidaceae bacterium]